MSNKKTVAILGASANREKFGNKSIRAHEADGFEIYPVNPKETEIEGYKTYPTLSDVPVDELDRISVYLPPHVGMTLLDEIVKVGAKEVWFNPGSEDEELLAKAREMGLKPIVACSIVDVGQHPSSFGS